MKNSKLAIAVMAATMCGSVHANADIRSLGMGGVQNAFSSYYTASQSNPAQLVNRYDEQDDFAILLPTVAVELDDNNELFDSIDNFQDAYDNLEAAINASNVDAAKAARDVLVDRFAELNGKLYTGVDIAVAVAMHSELGSFGLSASTHLDLYSGVTIDAGDITALDNASTTAELDAALNNIDSSGNVLAAAVTDYTFSYARSFSYLARPLSIGVNVKNQRVDIFDYNVNIDTFDDDDFDGDTYRRDDSNFNIDIGANYQFAERWYASLTARNLIKNTYSNAGILNISQTLDYEVNPQLNLGVSYRQDWVTVAVEADLNAYEGFNHTDNDDRQRLAIGAEFNAWDWAQFRLGYAQELAGEREDMITAGIGLSPFGAVRLDIAAQYADSRQFAVGAQFALTF